MVDQMFQAQCFMAKLVKSSLLEKPSKERRDLDDVNSQQRKQQKSFLVFSEKEHTKGCG